MKDYKIYGNLKHFLYLSIMMLPFTIGTWILIFSMWEENTLSAFFSKYSLIIVSLLFGFFLAQFIYKMILIILRRPFLIFDDRGIFVCTDFFETKRIERKNIHSVSIIEGKGQLLFLTVLVEKEWTEEELNRLSLFKRSLLEYETEEYLETVTIPLKPLYLRDKELKEILREYNYKME